MENADSLETLWATWGMGTAWRHCGPHGEWGQPGDTEVTRVAYTELGAVLWSQAARFESWLHHIIVVVSAKYLRLSFFIYEIN